MKSGIGGPQAKNPLTTELASPRPKGPMRIQVTARGQSDLLTNFQFH